MLQAAPRLVGREPEKEMSLPTQREWKTGILALVVAVGAIGALVWLLTPN
jgi:hypothetical protein